MELLIHSQTSTEVWKWMNNIILHFILDRVSSYIHWLTWDSMRIRFIWNLDVLDIISISQYCALLSRTFTSYGIYAGQLSLETVEFIQDRSSKLIISQFIPRRTRLTEPRKGKIIINTCNNLPNRSCYHLINPIHHPDVGIKIPAPTLPKGIGNDNHQNILICLKMWQEITTRPPNWRPK